MMSRFRSKPAPKKVRALENCMLAGMGCGILAELFLKGFGTGLPLSILTGTAAGVVAGLVMRSKVKDEPEQAAAAEPQREAVPEGVFIKEDENMYRYELGGVSFVTETNDSVAEFRIRQLYAAYRKNELQLMNAIRAYLCEIFGGGEFPYLDRQLGRPCIMVESFEVWFEQSKVPDAGFVSVTFNDDMTEFSYITVTA